MSAHQILLSLAALICLGNFAEAQQQLLNERIADDIQRLGHPRFDVRDRASRELLQIGEPALKSLKAVATSKDEEVRRRAESIVRAIEARLLNEALLKAPNLHLRYEAKPLDEAIADLKQKTGLPFVLDPKAGKNPKQPITLDTGDVPYWEAVEKFLAVAGLAEITDAKTAMPDQPVQQLNGRTRIYRQGVPAVPEKNFHLIENTIPVDAATGTLIRVKALAKRGPGATMTKGSNEIQFVLDVTPAPSLSWQGLVSVEIRKAVDDRGIMLAQSHLTPSVGMPNLSDLNNTLILNGGRQVIIQQGQAQLIIDGDWTGPAVMPVGNPRHIPVTLIGQEASSKTLKQVEGVITARVLTPVQPLLTVENLLAAPLKEPIKNGDHRIQIVGRTTNQAGAVQIRIRLETPVQTDVNFQLRGRQRALQIDNVTVANGQTTICFQDAQGKPIANVATNLQDQIVNEQKQSFEYTITLPKTIKTTDVVKLVLTGRRLVCVEVPFVLKNVPLP